jgi:TRAP-type mannitol/chloroaromatic compound transport system substrate-binding protein
MTIEDPKEPAPSSITRRAILTAGAAATATAALPAPAISQGRRQWRLVTAWPKNFPGLGTGAQRIADAITAMSEGALEVKLYAAGELVPAFEIFDAVRQGTAEMGHAAAGYWTGKSRSLAFFAVVPAGLVAQEQNAWLAYGGGQELWDESYGAFGLKALPAGNTGTQMGGWFNKEINGLDDIKGLRMRIPGLAGEVINRAGGVAINIPGGEIMSSMQSGAIDAVEFAGPWTDLAFGFNKAAKYYYGPGFHEPGATLELMINRAQWDDLPPHLREIVRHAAEAENQRMLSEFTAGNAVALAALRSEHDIVPRTMPNDVIRELRAISAEVVAETAHDGALPRRIFDNWSKFRHQAAALAPYAEQGALNQRML